MQKVFFLATSLNIGGTEKFLATLIDRLKDSFEFTVGYIKENGHVGHQLALDGVRVIHVPGFIELVSLLRRGDYCLLHTFLYRANILGRMAGKIAGIPAVVSSQQAIDAWRKPWHVWADRFSARFCDAIIANAASTRELLIRTEHIPESRVSVVYNGIDLDASAPRVSRSAVRRSLGVPDDAPLVISVIRLHREKGVDLIPLIARDVPDAYFLIAGDGPERESLEQLSKDNKRMILTGWRDDVNDLLAAADLFLLPSREESFPQAILEAMAQGLPAVAADVGGVSELVLHGETGLLVPPESIEGFVRAVRESLGQSGDRLKDMRMRSRERAEQFSEKTMIDSIRAIYTKLTGGTSPCMQR